VPPAPWKWPSTVRREAYAASRGEGTPRTIAGLASRVLGMAHTGFASDRMAGVGRGSCSPSRC
jgi:hypothetical protein